MNEEREDKSPSDVVGRYGIRQGTRGRTIAVAMTLACCCRGRTGRRGQIRTVVSPHDNLDIRERARVDAHDIRVLAVGIRPAVRHERRATE